MLTNQNETGNTQPQNQQQHETEIAVRLYDNKLHGTTYGKALYRSAIYNGTLDLSSPTIKYLVDYYSYADWCNKAKTDGQMTIVKRVECKADTLYSWTYRYDEAQHKTVVDGFSTIDLNNKDVFVLICDEEEGIAEQWNLVAKRCKPSSSGKKIPQLFATNCEL
jgi:hypothetical protein